MEMSSPFAPERIASAEVDPELIVVVLDEAAEERRGLGGVELFAVCTAVYADVMGIDTKPGEDAFDEIDLLTIFALASRVAALSGLIETGHIDRELKTPAGGERLAAAAAVATLIQKDDRAAFQLLDFLARVERAMADAK